MWSDRKIVTATPEKKEVCIRSLPEEVICMIFDRLDLESVKNASVTCQRWHSIIFLSGYINRFVFKIKLNSSLRNTSAQQIQEFKAVMAMSQRCYRRLRWDDAEGLEDDEFSSVWETIHPEVTKHLHSLELYYVDSCKFLPLIADALPLIPALRSLTVWDDRLDVGTQDVIPTLRSNILKHLTIHSNVKYRLDMPHLQSFKGQLFAFDIPDDSRVALSSLKDLSVYFYDALNGNGECMDNSQQRIPMLRSLFRQARLEKIMWDAPLKSEVFSLICKTCSTLKELHLQYDLSNVNDLKRLSKLTNLRILGIINFHLIDIDLSKLNQLEEMQLSVKSVVKLPASIKKLQVCISADNELNMSHTILSSGIQLTELVVEIYEDEDYFERHAPLDIFETLPHLKHLQVLKFIRGCFKRSSFLCMDAPLDSLHHLHFEESNVSSKHFLGLKKKFPNLKKLSFSKFGCLIECYESPSNSIFCTESDEAN